MRPRLRPGASPTGSQGASLALRTSVRTCLRRRAGTGVRLGSRRQGTALRTSRGVRRDVIAVEARHSKRDGLLRRPQTTAIAGHVGVGALREAITTEQRGSLLGTTNALHASGSRHASSGQIGKGSVHVGLLANDDRRRLRGRRRHGFGLRARHRL